MKSHSLSRAKETAFFCFHSLFPLLSSDPIALLNYLTDLQLWGEMIALRSDLSIISVYLKGRITGGTQSILIKGPNYLYGHEIRGGNAANGDTVFPAIVEFARFSEGTTPLTTPPL